MNNISPQEAQNLAILLQRVPLEGKEALTFVGLMQKLQTIAQSQEDAQAPTTKEEAKKEKKGKSRPK